VSGWPAILGGTPVRSGKDWPRWPQWGERERELLGATLESGAWSEFSGEQGARMAAELAEMHGAGQGLALTNGTHTLEAALAACDVGEGDEVIVPALTYVASATAVLAVNATPVLVDVDPESLCIDVAAAAAAVGERTRAIVAVHLAGRPCDLDALGELCEKRGLALVEDCAHAHGSRWRGRGVGSFGAFGSFSFQESKLVTAGEGGALISGDEQSLARAWSYVNCGRAEQVPGFNHVSYGSNLRLSEWQSAVLRAQLERLPAHNATRAERAELLDSELGGFAGLTPQSGDPRIDLRARFAYVFRYDPEEFGGLSLFGFEQALAREGILVGKSYPSINTLELFREGRFGPRLRGSAPRIDYGALRLPHAERAAEGTVWLHHPMLLAEPEDVLDVVRAIEKVKAHASAIALRTSRSVRAGGRLLRGARRRLSRAR
jgi:dTDP-4-amino-4,6-dideoxygalactose transaminase